MSNTTKWIIIGMAIHSTAIIILSLSILGLTVTR